MTAEFLEIFTINQEDILLSILLQINVVLLWFMKQIVILTKDLKLY